MSLRTKLLALSLLTLLLPWSGWKLLRELENYLRESQETTLLASARVVAAGLPLQFRTRLAFLPAPYLSLRALPMQPTLDGYADDWPDAEQAQAMPAAGGEPAVQALAGSHGGRLYLFLHLPQAAGFALLLRNPRGLRRYAIDPEAPGPLQLSGEGVGPGQGEGYWLEGAQGISVELSLPTDGEDTEIAFLAAAAGVGASSGDSATWVSLRPGWRDLSGWLREIALPAQRAWLVDRDGWVLADSDSGRTGREQAAQKTTWLQRLAYRLVAGQRPGTVRLENFPADPVRLDAPAVQAALGGHEAIGWAEELNTAAVRGMAAVPVVLDGGPAGAAVLQSSSEGLLLVTNRALGRLLLTTLVLALGLTGVLWLFATRLSRRVRRLGGAVSRAMDDRVDPESLPLRNDRDELGELARNNERLLRAVGDYSHYLQTLAGKLSHELKTPLAITRSSLDNLDHQPLDDEARRFLERAREGVDRQAALVRAMSEASRLEAAIGAAEWAQLDLVQLLAHCGEGYRALYRGRHLALALPPGPAPLYCAPDLLAQALDKLVDNAMSLSRPDDEVSIELRAAGTGYELAVRNSGSSLPEDLQERLFDSLVSVRDQRGEAPHLGLGLYIVRLVVEAHRGTVSARNLPDDGGVEFRIHLPRS